MNKEQLKVKLEALEVTVEARREQLGVAVSEAQITREEIANAGKPVISQSIVDDLVEQLTEMFSDVVGNADPCDMSPEFALNYNEISLECLDMSNIGVSDHDIQSILEDFFAIEEDEDEDEE